MAFETFVGEPSECELYARFAYLLIQKDYHAHGERYSDPGAAIGQLRGRLAPVDDSMLDLFLAAYQYMARRGVLLEFARTSMIERARKGLDFRSVVFVDYKATRRSDPRVTNRGVAARRRKETD